MVKIIFEFTFFFVVSLLLLTQVIIPSFSKNLSYFWLFKHKNDSIPAVGTLDELDKEVDSSVEQMKQTKEKVELAAEKVAEMKQKTKQ